MVCIRAHFVVENSTFNMNRRHYLMLEAMMKSSGGLSREELNSVLQAEGFSPLNRKRFFQELKHIRKTTNLELTSTNCGKNVWRHGIRMESEEDRNRADFAYMLVSNLLEADFLSDFRGLGKRIQPIAIPHGNHHLQRRRQGHNNLWHKKHSIPMEC